MHKSKPKKSLGQNFLRDKVVLEKIIASANISAKDLVLEIGPGEGALTKELAKVAGRILAIEIDAELAKKTSTSLKFENKTTIISGDVLEINLPKLLEQNNFTTYKVVANIPYYITSPIIRLLLETTYPPNEMYLMVQKEVAERIVASQGQMSILALSVQYYADAELLFTVPKSAFFPVPKVDSAIIKIVPKKIQANSKEYTKKFFRLIKAGFSSKRKTLANNLSACFGLEKTKIIKSLEELGFNQNIRAQELSLADWKKLVENFSS